MTKKVLSEVGAAGGRARAERLSPEERAEIARQAAQRRWERTQEPVNTPDMPVVLEGYKGTLDIGGMQLPCAVIQGANGIQRVLSENGITNAILGTRSGATKRLKAAGAPLPMFLAPRQLRPHIEKDLLDGPLKPIDYRDGERILRAYDAAILPAVCNVWLKARAAGDLQDQQLGKAQKAEILMRGLAETGIVALIDEVTGYEKIRPQNALEAYLAKVIRRELAAWVKKFPDEFYENIYKLRGWQWPGMQKNRFSVVAHYTRDLVYERLGPSILQELERKTPKNEKGQRVHRMHRWLTEDIGDPMLAQHLHALVMFQRLAIANGYGWHRFVKTVDQVLPKRGTTLPIPFPEPDEQQ